jgi:Flp pilus assembly protein TadB
MGTAVGILAGGAVLALAAAIGVRVDRTVATLIGRPAAARRPGNTLLRRLTAQPLLRCLARTEVLSLRLQASGGERSLEDVVFVKVLAAAGPAACVLVLAPSLAPLAPVAACGGWLVPDLVLARAVRARMRRADAELPQFLDLLAAASSAGLAAGAAIKRAASGLRGPLAEELVRAAASVEVGGRWRVELGAIAVRLRLPDLNAAVAAIARTEILGSSLGESLRELAEDVRESRRSRVAERARTAPVKMLFPLVFMILPAFLLLTVVPVLIATLRSLK